MKFSQKTFESWRFWFFFLLHLHENQSKLLGYQGWVEILMITLVYSKRVSVHNNLLHNSVLVFWTKNGNQWNNHFGQINKTLHHSHSKYPVPKQKLVLGFFFNHNLAIEELEFPNGIFNLGSLCFIVSHDRSFARAQTH